MGGSWPSGGCVSASDTVSGVDVLDCSDRVSGGLRAGSLVNKDSAGAAVTKTLTVTGAGTHNLSCTAIDAAGNMSPAGTATITIDTTAPSPSP